MKIHRNAINCAPYLFVSAFQLDRWLKWYDPNRRVTVISIQINLLFLDDYSQSERERERRLVEVIFFVWAFACVLPFFAYFPSIFSSANICSQRLILSSICTLHVLYLKLISFIRHFHMFESYVGICDRAHKWIAAATKREIESESERNGENKNHMRNQSA